MCVRLVCVISRRDQFFCYIRDEDATDINIRVFKQQFRELALLQIVAVQTRFVAALTVQRQI